MTDSTPKNEDLEEYPMLVERKHKLKRYRRLVSGHQFVAVEVWPPNGKKPAVTVLQRIEPPPNATAQQVLESRSERLQLATKEGKRLVGVLVAHGGKIPLTESGTDMTFDTRQAGLASLNPMSASGKRQWCPEHWKAVEEGMTAGTHNGLFAGLILSSVWIDTMTKEGIFRGQVPVGYAMEMLRDSYHPLCCWAGPVILEMVMRESRLDRLAESGLVQQLQDKINRGGG